MKTILKLIFSLACFGFVFILGYLFHAGYDKYQEKIQEIPLAEKIESIRNQENYISIDAISEDFLDAIVATEDRRFFEHNGIDWFSIIRSFLSNLKEGEIVQGGSSISQQLIKNMYFDHDKDFVRKIAEVFFIHDLEKQYSKEEILELYVNLIYYGKGYYGIQQASLGYFNKLPHALTLEEATYLAGLPQAPSVYSNNEEKAKIRQNHVMQALTDSRSQ